MEVPLLGRDVNHELTEFWSPTQRPPRAPPSSPKLIAYDLDSEHQNCSTTDYRTLAYLDQQLGITSPCTGAHQSRVSASCRFSFQTQWSLDDENSTTNDIQQSIVQYDDDGITLVDVSSPMRSSISNHLQQTMDIRHANGDASPSRILPLHIYQQDVKSIDKVRKYTKLFFQDVLEPYP
ncbi:MAG: hypothetical protein Q9195_000879 [Heterodermia aff. obscurata]